MSLPKNRDERIAYYEELRRKEELHRKAWINPVNGIRLNKEQSDDVVLPYAARYIIKYCDDCGTASYGIWKYPIKRNWGPGGLYSGEYPVSFKPDEEYVEGINKCPLCGGNLRGISYQSDEEGRVSWKSRYSDYGVSHYNPNYTVEKSLDATIHSFDLPAFVYNRDYAIATKRVEDNLKQWDVPVYISPTNALQDIKSTPQKLMDYILQLIHLEFNILGLSQRLEPLYFNHIQLKRRSFCEEKVTVSLLETRVNELRDSLDELNSLPSTDDLFPLLTPVPVNYPPKPEPPIYAQSKSIFESGKIKKQNKLLQIEYERALSQYQDYYSKCKQEENRRIQAANEENERRRKASNEENKKRQEKYNSEQESLNKLLPLLEQAKAIASQHSTKELYETSQKEIEEAEKLLQETIKARNELYSYNIVFGKYRNIVSLTTFYEYLMSGRCTTLEGANGAYNIYENETRLNMIVSQLSQVLEKLEEIKSGQYMLYTELQSIKSGVSMLNNKMDNAIQSLESIAESSEKTAANTERIADNTDRIAYSTEVTAFYAKKNAELTDALGYMTAFK